MVLTFHLHSIMLLLYRFSSPYAIKHSPYLHSIMLLLYLRSGHVYGISDCIYIPLCFYFIGNGVFKEYWFLFIYIPLCFYFINVKPFLNPGSDQSTFHYASTLSKRGQRGPGTSTIYIPLCFYFIAIVPDNILPFSIIYIPLCFYFIPVKDDPFRLYRRSTFHYASTLSGLRRHDPDRASHLHSIMLLLYRMAWKPPR